MNFQNQGLSVVSNTNLVNPSDVLPIGCLTELLECQAVEAAKSGT